jgi:hypothetical protein
VKQVGSNSQRGNILSVCSSNEDTTYCKCGLICPEGYDHKPFPLLIKLKVVCRRGIELSLGSVKLVGFVALVLIHFCAAQRHTSLNTDHKRSHNCIHIFLVVKDAVKQFVLEPRMAMRAKPPCSTTGDVVRCGEQYMKSFRPGRQLKTARLWFYSRQCLYSENQNMTWVDKTHDAVTDDQEFVCVDTSRLEIMSNTSDVYSQEITKLSAAPNADCYLHSL